MKKLIGITVTLMILLNTEAYPSGAPSFACSSLEPLHSSNQASGPSPYKVDVSTIGAYVPGQSYVILLQSTSSVNFKGFLIQARSCADNTPVGSFSKPSIGSAYKQLCSGNTGATHTSNSERSSVTVQWTAPPANTGAIRFWYTFVEVNSGSNSRYWANEMSDCIKEDVDECNSNPCQNGGTCSDGIDSFTCDCEDGYTGELCEVDIDDCDPNPCQNGGTCSDGIDSFTCDCENGYTGELCDVDIDDCDPNPCQNGAICTDRINSFTCDCEDGYTGARCEITPCPIKGQIRKPCASDSSCHRTCDNRFLFFLPCPEVCVVNGCECPDGLLINEDKNECIPGSKCKPVECPGKGQFYTVDCFPFNATCNNPNPPSLCDAPRCVCPLGQVLDEEINTCVKTKDCSNHKTCKLRKITGDVTYDNDTMTATVEFNAGSGVTTECQVDKHPYISCESPFSFKVQNAGKHIITVRASRTKKFRFVN